MLFSTLLSLKPRYLGIAALGVIGVLAAIPIVLSNDMPWVAVSFERGTYSVAEGNSVTVKVALNVVPERQVVVPITKANEDGASNSDYSGVPAYVTFESGETEKSFTFSVSQDMVDDDGESVQLGFGSSLPTGVTEGATDETTVFLIDDDGIGVTVPPATLTIGEGSSKTYTMALTSQPTASVTVTVAAPSGSDVSVDKTTLTFTSSNWDDEQTVTVSAAQDDDALDETATITHSVTSTDSDYNGIRAGSIDVTVIDDEDIPVTVTFDQAGHTIAEGSAVTVRVTLSEDPERQVVIPITKSEQGGITTADYSGVPDSVTFESGDTEKSFIVTAAQDALDDDDESVTVGLGTLPNAVTVGAIKETTVAINDDDVPSVTIRFEQASYSLDEGSEVTVKVILSHDPERQVVVPITKSEQGGATSADYSGVPENVTFESGETEKSFTFTATQDMVDDDGTGDGESVRVAFGTLPADVGAGATNETTVAIIDDDGAGVTVSPTRLSIGEGRSRTYTVALASEPTANVTVTVTAPSDSDVSVDKRSLTFNTSNWEDEQTVSVSAAQDFDGSDDTATITHSVTAAGSDYSGKPVASVSVTVIDDDDVRVKVNFEEANYRVTEGSTVTVRVTLSEDPERQVVLPITTTEQGGATSDDYSGVPASVTFESGDTEKSFTFTATQDKADDDGESVKLDFGTLPKAVTGGPTDETTVTITDDDPTIIVRDEETPVVAKAPDVPVKVSFERTGYTVVEGYTVTVTVVLSKDPERQVVIPITKTEEGGITSADYSGVPASVTFNSGDTSSSFTFTATQDALQDDDESLRLDLGSLPDAVTAGTLKVTIVSIIDDDGPVRVVPVTVSFETNSYSVDEGSRVGVKVMLSGDPGRRVVIPLTKTEYGGITPSDYSGVPSQVIFESGEREKSFDFLATEDMLDDDEEAVALAFGSSLPDAVTRGATDQTMVNIKDNDGVGVRVSPTRLTIDEGEDDTYTVVLNSQPTADVTVTVGTPTDPDVSVNKTTLTFTDSTWEDAQTVTVSTVHDQDAADDTATIAHSVASTDGDYNGITARSVSVKVTDDEEVPVTVNFASATYSANEGGTVRVTVTLDEKPEREVVIHITKTEQGDASSSDYSGVPDTITFRSGDTAKYFTFSGTQDNIDDDGESVLLGFSATLPNAVTAGTTDETTISINDDDGVGVRVTPTTLTIGEGGDEEYTVVLNSQPTASVTVTISSSGSSDVSANKQTLTFTDSTWDDRQTVTVSAAHDTDAVDDDATITHSVTSTDTDYNGISAGSVGVTVTDDDDIPVTVSFDQATYSVGEGERVTVTVTLSEDPERRVVIPITKMEQDGATSVDYSRLPGNVIFVSGETEKTFTFSAVQDTVDDDGESVKLGFGTRPNAVTEGTYNEATVSINDDDNPLIKVSFESATYSVDEGDDVTVTVTLSAAPERQIVIPITTTDQDDASSADYSPLPADVTFASGETEKTLTFTATQDTVDDDGESVKLSFGSPLPNRVSEGTTDETTVAINDDDVPSVTVSFEESGYSVDEGDEVTVKVTLSADPERLVIIPITTTEQGDVSSADYSPVPGTVTFESGETEATFTFTALEDALDDDDESVLLGFDTSLLDRVDEGTTNETTVVINDDDVPSVTVSFEEAAHTLAEGDDVTVTVKLSADPERQVIIHINTSEDGATSDDYSGVPDTVTFESGDTEKTFDFTAVQDTVDDDGESVKLGFGTLPDDVTPGTTDETTISITDDDDPLVKVNFGQAAYSVAEASTVTVTVTLSADPEREVVILITKTDQGGVSSTDDYSGVPETLTFPSGDTEETFTFTATHDTINDDGESVKLGFGSSLPNRISGGTTAETTVNINDDDAHGVTISPSSLTIGEGDDDTYTVVLTSEPTDDVTITITVPSGSDISANSPANTQTLTFTDSTWQVEQTVTVSAGQDNDHLDDTGTITHSVTSTDTDYNNFGAGSVEVTTTDDEDVPVTVSFEQASYEVAEGGTVTVKVTLSEDPERYVIIPIVKTEQDGATSDDYLSLPLIVTFTGGETEQVFSFAAVQDTVDDDGESVKLALDTSQLDRVSDGTTVETTVSINDDDVPSVEVFFEFDTYSVDEGDDVTVKVKLSADPERQVIIPIMRTHQDGASTLDYSPVPGTLTFESGDTEKTFTFTATQDTVDDDGESVKLGFDSPLPTGVSEGTPSEGTPNEATVSINDDDVPPVTVSFEFDTYSVDEGGTVDYKVKLSADPERFVIIPITVSEDGATSADYSAPPPNASFFPGETEVIFTFTATQDTVDDDGESVKLGFDTSLLDRVSEGTTNETTVSINDDDVPSVEVSFESDTYSVTEGSTVTVKVKLSADPERQVIITVTASEQGGADTSDYSGVPVDVTFESGETEQTFTFTAEQDTVDDDNESVRLRFDSNLPDQVSEGLTNNEATVSIDDDDVPSIEVSFELATYSVNEGSTVEVKVKLSADPERQVIIPITTNEQDGASSNDYSPMPDNVTFQAGETEVILDFIARSDSLNDDGESVKLSLGSQLPDQVDPGTPDETTISINDDDGASVKVTPTSLTITEGSSQGYTVVLTSQPTHDVTITVTPPSNPDVSVNKTTLTFTADTWDDEQTVTVSVAHDTDALAETATITHSAASTDTDYDGISVGSVNVTVIDDETEVSFGAEMYMATEGGEDATVTVHLSQPAPARLVIRITEEGKAGATSDDWSGVPATVTFNVGEDEKSFTVVATDDDVEDSGEKVEIGFGSPLPSGVILGDPDTTMVTLANAECDNLATEIIILDELGEITQAGEKDFWTFDPDPYRFYIIEVIGVDGRDMLGRDTHPGDLTLEDPELISVRAVEGTDGAEYSSAVDDGGYGTNSNGIWWWSSPGPFRIEVGGKGGTGTYQIKVRVNNICAMRDGERTYPHAGGPDGYDMDQVGDTTTRRILRTVPVWHNGYGPGGGFLGDNHGEERDEDWFKVELDQGYEYTIELWSATDIPAEHQATQLKIVGIYDSNGDLIAGTASSGTGNHVSVDFRPTTTGVYYVAVGYEGQDGLYDIDATGTAV